MAERQYWLMKSEPDVFGIDHLIDMPNQTEHWDGVRNYQVRNMMRDDMKIGDLAFFYHSNTKVPGVVGIMEVVREGYVDHTQFDPDCKYYDPKAKEDNPRWYMVDIKFVEKFARTVSLQEMKDAPELSELRLVQKGNRLSAMKIDKAHWDLILKML